MEKDIEEVLNEVEKPEFNKSDTTEQLIFKYLEYLKNVERARGLTDEQITAKYVNGRCGNLQMGIASVLKTMDREYATRKITCKAPEGIENYVDGSHFVIELYDEKTGKSQYYDIRGKSDRESLNEFAENFYVKNPKYHHMAREVMSDYEMDEDVPDEAYNFIYDDLVEAKTTQKEEQTIHQDKNSNTEYNRENINQSEIDTLKTQMEHYYKGQSILPISEINKKCAELGLDFNNEMQQAKDRNNLREALESYDKLVTEEQFKLYDESEKLGLDFKKELDSAKARVSLRNDMKAFFNGKKDLTIEEINAKCTELGLDFNNEMTIARDGKLPLATDIKENTQKMANTQLSRDIQDGQAEVKNNYIEYDTPNKDKEAEK